MKATMQVSLPVPLKEWVDQQVEQGGYATPSEYVRQLLREEQKRQTRRAVEAKLQEALDSGDPVPVTEQTWKASEQRVAERLRQTSRKRRSHGTNR